MLDWVSGSNNEAQQFLTRGAEVIVRMRGLPYDCTAQQIVSTSPISDPPDCKLENLVAALLSNMSSTYSASANLPLEGDLKKARWITHWITFDRIRG